MSVDICLCYPTWITHTYCICIYTVRVIGIRINICGTSISGVSEPIYIALAFPPPAVARYCKRESYGLSNGVPR